VSSILPGPNSCPPPESATEDEGVILSNVFDSATKKSFLLLLNAMNFLEVARIDAPQKIPFKFHGNFFKNH
jgi:carotenoid cleavage dioxygenase-like enzyme